ncbi:osteopetrosis-associated transmembrane protein 1 [Pelodytes ibericus]
MFHFVLYSLCLVLSLSQAHGDVVVGSDFMPRAVWAEEISLSLLPSYYTAPELSEDPAVCTQLRLEFANRSAALSGCLVENARPVRLCQGCYKEYAQLGAVMDKITLKPYRINNTDSCAISLLQSDRLHMLVILNEFFKSTWLDSKCDNCLQKNSTEVQNGTITFMELYRELNQCFEHNMKEPPILTPEGNYSSVCHNCNESYKSLNTLYSTLEQVGALCIDLEDAMNSTRILWSREFNCTLPFTDTVPVIAVSAFILFLPVVFYLSSFLHSEQKKLKLVLPKRFTNNAGVSNIQEHSN